MIEEFMVFSDKKMSDENLILKTKEIKKYNPPAQPKLLSKFKDREIKQNKFRRLWWIKKIRIRNIKFNKGTRSIFISWKSFKKATKRTR